MMVVSRPVLLVVLGVLAVAAAYTFWPAADVPAPEENAYSSVPPGDFGREAYDIGDPSYRFDDESDDIWTGTESMEHEQARRLNHTSLDGAETEDDDAVSGLLRQLETRAAERDAAPASSRDRPDSRNRKPDTANAPKGVVAAAQQLIDTGKYDEAIALLKESIENQPKNAQARKLLGTILLNMGRTDEALAVYEDWRAQIPGDPAPYLQLARLHGQLGARPEALGYLERYLQLNGGDLGAYQNAATLYRRFGMQEQEGALLSQWASAAPDSADAMRSLADYYRRTGQVGAALAQYQRVAELMPENVQAYRDLSTAYVRAGQYDAAISSLESALYLRPTDANAMLQLGDTYRAAGHPYAAIEAYHQVIAAHSGTPQADRAARFAQRVENQIARAQQRAQ
jgi:tetratricopeptide (TPR) repeat protein